MSMQEQRKVIIMKLMSFKTSKGKIYVQVLSESEFLEYNDKTSSGKKEWFEGKYPTGGDQDTSMEYFVSKYSFEKSIPAENVKMFIPVNAHAPASQADEYTVTYDGYEYSHYYIMEQESSGYYVNEYWSKINPTSGDDRSVKHVVMGPGDRYGGWDSSGREYFNYVLATESTSSLTSFPFYNSGLGHFVGAHDIKDPYEPDSEFSLILSDDEDAKDWTDEDTVDPPTTGAGGFEITGGPRVGTTGNGFYMLDSSDIANLFNNINNTTLLESFNSLFGFTYEGVLSLKYYPNTGLDEVDTGDKLVIRLGNSDLIYGSEARGYVVLDDQYTKSFTLTQPFARKHNNFLDASPYTTCQIFLPFNGWIEVNPELVYGKDVRVDYNISTETGRAVISVYTGGVLYDNYAIDYGIDVPVNATGALTAGALGMSAGMKIAGAVGGAIATGGVGAAIGLGMASSAASTMFSPNPTAVGSFGNNIGLLGSQSFITKMITVNPVDRQPYYYGYPDNSFKKISDCGNFIQGGNLQLYGPVTPKYLQEINTLIAQGILWED